MSAFLIDNKDPVINLHHGNILVKHCSDESQDMELKVLKLQVGNALATAATQLSQIVFRNEYNKN